LVQAFASRFIHELRPHVRAVAESLIDAKFEAGAMDFIADFANWLPAHVICRILGLPDADIPAFTRAVYRLSRAFSSTFTPGEVPDMQDAAGDLKAYVEGLIADRRQHPREDFLTAFVAACDASGNLSHTEELVQL